MVCNISSLSRHNRKSLFLTKVYSNIHFFKIPLSLYYSIIEGIKYIQKERKKEAKKLVRNLKKILVRYKYG